MRNRERGAVALEFALVLPSFLLLLLGLGFLGEGFIVRFLLSDAAMLAARSCVINRQMPECPDAQRIIIDRLGTFAAYCSRGLTVMPASLPVTATTSALRVSVNCAADPAFGRIERSVVASAATPF